MTRRNQVALLAAIALLIAVSGTVLATRSPSTAERPALLASSHEPEPQDEAEDAPPTADELTHASDRLTERGIAFTDVELADLAGRYGLGGAIRILAWAADPTVGLTAGEIAARRDGDGTEAVGWGKLAKELGVHPGIGWIMGNGGGHGRDSAPGQQDGDSTDD